MNHRFHIPFFATLTGLLVLSACGRDAQQTNLKLAGVGLDPEEIGPEPSLYGGLIEYDWVDMAGAHLPLGLLGLVSYDGAGPEMGDFKPPYVLVNGLGFVFESDAPATDTLYGNFAAPPAKVGTCYTEYEPQAYISNLADLGTEIDIKSDESDAGWAIGRRPLFYPADVRDVFPYYLELETWRTQPRTKREVYDESLGLSGLRETDYQSANYAPGELHTVSFPGAIPPREASWGSIPVPLATSSGSHSYTLPTVPSGVMLSWDGPQYTYWGEEAASGKVSTCLQFRAHASSPTSPDDCLALEEPTTDDFSFEGQVYTAPWDTADGVTFQWEPPEEDIDQAVTISVRFLGPVKEDDEYKQVAVVRVPANDDATDNWADAQEDGLIPSGTPDCRLSRMPEAKTRPFFSLPPSTSKTRIFACSVSFT